MIKKSIYQNDIVIINLYPRSSKCIKQKLTEQKGEIDKSTILEDSNIFLSVIDITSIKNYRRLEQKYQPTWYYWYLWNILPNNIAHTFFSSAHGMFNKIYNMQSNKISLSKFKSIKIIYSMLFDHNKNTLEIIYFQTHVWKTLKYLEIKQHSSQ